MGDPLMEGPAPPGGFDGPRPQAVPSEGTGDPSSRRGCAVCGGALRHYTTVADIPYDECLQCGSFLMAPAFMAQVDQGTFQRPYDADYWQAETSAARERSFGPALARISELLLYARKPVERLIDIGAGPGFLLDALTFHLPSSKDRFWGVELFPPASHTAHPNYVIGSLADMPGTFDAGICIEVFEHLTPDMLRGLAKAMAAKSSPNSLYLINTGLPDFVRHEDPGYLDPYGRGHVASYGLKAIDVMFSPHGFTVLPLKGKTWAYLLEYRPSTAPPGPAQDRIWTARPENRRILDDPLTGSLLYVLGLDTARAY